MIAMEAIELPAPTKQATIALPQPRINHVVGHFKVKSNHLQALTNLLSTTAATIENREAHLPTRLLNVKRQSNFIVIKDTNFTYNVFTSSGHVNVYRITNLETHPTLAIDGFCSLLESIGKKEDLLVSQTVKIINITAAGKLDVSNEGIDLYEAKHIYDNSGENFFTRLTYNPDIYAGLSFKSSIGTINLFTSGSYTILGVKSKEALDLIHKQLCAFIQTL
jgi:hypothetical protein